MNPPWLPELIELSDYGGDWGAYLEATYAEYLKDFHTHPFPMYEGRIVSSKKIPEQEGKSATFWHVTGDGDHGDKAPSLDRCARIRWARAIIENHLDPAVLVWRESGFTGGDRTILWLKQCDYVVIIAHRQNYDLFWTAYEVSYGNTKRKLQRRYDYFQKANIAT